MPRKKDIQWLQGLAAKKGGKCLSTEYINNKTKYLWECSEGDKWEAKANDIQQGGWCPICSSNGPNDLQWLQDLATKHGGKCLSTEYKNNETKYLWKCSKEGHQWEARAGNIQQGRWCPYCAERVPHDLQWLQELAAKRSGKCLSVEYNGMRSIYLWECPKGCRWEASANNIQQGKWCPKCAKKQSRKEIELRNFIRQYYPEVSDKPVRRLLPNKRFEIDIWMPSSRKGVEFDGEYRHSQPRQKESDARKDSECLRVGIKLMRVKCNDYIKNTEAVRQRVLEFLHA